LYIEIQEGQTVAGLIRNTQEKHNMPVADCGGQGHDNDTSKIGY